MIETYSTLILSFVITITTIVYTWFTWKLVLESKKMRDIQITPDINLYFEFNEVDASFLYLVIENNGLGIAQNVDVNLVNKIDIDKKELDKIENFGAVKNGFKSFYSKQKYKYYLTDLSQNYDSKIDKEIVFEVRYQNINRVQYFKKVNLPIEELIGLSKLTPETHIGKIAYCLEKLNKTIENLKETKV